MIDQLVKMMAVPKPEIISVAKKISEPEKISDSPAIQKNFPAAPCPICRSPIFWFDRYENAPHCLACQPPPSKALVARTDDVLTLGDNQFSWLSDRASNATGDVQNDDREFEQQFRCYTSRDGKREVIERRDWSHTWSMIVEK